jgi:hypothetical protein
MPRMPWDKQLDPAAIAAAMRSLAADWYADAMRLPDRPEHAAEVVRARRLCDDLEALADGVEDGDLRRQPTLGLRDEGAEARGRIEAEVYSILDMLADEAVDAHDNGDPIDGAVETATDSMMKLIDRLQLPPPADEVKAARKKKTAKAG